MLSLNKNRRNLLEGMEYIPMTAAGASIFDPMLCVYTIIGMYVAS